MKPRWKSVGEMIKNTKSSAFTISHAYNVFKAHKTLWLLIFSLFSSPTPSLSLLLSSRPSFLQVASFLFSPLLEKTAALDPPILPSFYLSLRFFKSLVHFFLCICSLADSSYVSPVFPKYSVFLLAFYAFLQPCMCWHL